MTAPLNQLRISALPESTAHRLLNLIENDPANEPLSVAMMRADDRSNTWSIEALYHQPPERQQVAGWLDGLLPPGTPAPEYQIEPLVERDWVARSQQALKPVHAGQFVVHGRHDRARYPHRRFALEIDAGQAFGTGHHATTVGCLLALQRFVHASEPQWILDIGTGTGVLAIAARKLCPAHIIAGDIDPLAVAIASQNARNNGVGNAIRFIEAAGTDARAIRLHRYDLIIANILERPLIALATDIMSLAHPGAGIILSGLLTDQARTVFAHYRCHGAVLRRRVEIDGWTTLTLSARRSMVGT